MLQLYLVLDTVRSLTFYWSQRNAHVLSLFFLLKYARTILVWTADTDSSREFDDVSAAGIHSIPVRDPSPA